jgi:hypothetical protein
MTAAGCALLLIIFAGLSYSSALTKSATADEPLHLVGAYLHGVNRDFSMNVEDPALFGWTFSIPLHREILIADRTSPAYHGIPSNLLNQALFAYQTLYLTPRSDEQSALNRSRAVGTIVGVLLGSVIALWAYKLAGGAAALVATGFFALDPNFIAHSSLVKNDVLLSLCLTALMFCVWALGRRTTWVNLLAAALLAGACVSVKFSGVIVGPILAIALLCRAGLSGAWHFLGIDLPNRPARIAGAVAACAACAAVSFVMIWAVYCFRFDPAPEPTRRWDFGEFVRLAKTKELMLPRIRAQVAAGITNPKNEFADEITPDQVVAHRPSAVIRLVAWAEQSRLLPQSWLAGFLYTYGTTLFRNSYLNGQVRHLGWWYYFPLAMLYKTPLAMLLAGMAAIAATCVASFRRLARAPRDWWPAAALATAPLIYGLLAVTSNLNLGLRHVLPIYPFVYIAIGVAAARAVQMWHRAAPAAIAVLFAGLGIETAASWPNYLSFFNAAAGGARGGIRLLGDSNLDWGQDLKRLAEWQKRHPEERLYLSYFGTADPEYYGVRAKHIPGSYIFAQPEIPQESGVLAVSATNLQGIYLDPDMRDTYRMIRDSAPFDVLGGTVYLYRFPIKSGGSH